MVARRQAQLVLLRYRLKSILRQLEPGAFAELLRFSRLLGKVNRRLAGVQ